LIDDGAIAARRDGLLQKAKIVTPNRYEGQILSNLEIQTLEDMQEAAKRIFKLGAQAVLLKGGGMSGSLRGVDVWFDGEHLLTLTTETVETTNTHGTGCTLAAALAANLAQGKDLFTAVKLAKDFVTKALRYCYTKLG